MDFIYDPSLALYLPLYELDGASFASRDAYGHLCTVTGALWRPNGHYLDGLDDYIDCGNPAALHFGTGSFSIITWIKTATAENTRIANKRNGTSEGFEVFIRGASSGALGLILKDTSANSYSAADTSTDLTDDVWHCVAVLIDRVAGVATYMVDSGSDGTGDISAVTGDIDHTNTFKLGIDDGLKATEAFDGLIGEFLAYKRALTLLEYQRIYLVTKWRYR